MSKLSSIGYTQCDYMDNNRTNEIYIKKRNEEKRRRKRVLSLFFVLFLLAKEINRKLYLLSTQNKTNKHFSESFLYLIHHMHIN